MVFSAGTVKLLSIRKGSCVSPGYPRAGGLSTEALRNTTPPDEMWFVPPYASIFTGWGDTERERESAREMQKKKSTHLLLDEVWWLSKPVWKLCNFHPNIWGFEREHPPYSIAPPRTLPPQPASPTLRPQRQGKTVDNYLVWNFLENWAVVVRTRAGAFCVDACVGGAPPGVKGAILKIVSSSSLKNTTGMSPCYDFKS